ncbi:unnamed protein product [Polarella glacialis]|uniref:Uncharacterized protein n=1 Tax=Polarella glacialis TaxID=89957 RepID=A0A813FNG2_POLGL|nr:unnamed protein product [Polarella glacialis]
MSEDEGEESRRLLVWVTGALAAFAVSALVGVGQSLPRNLQVSLAANVGLSALGFVATASIIGGLGQCFIKANLRGIDLNKRTTKRDAEGNLVRPIEKVYRKYQGSSAAQKVFVRASSTLSAKVCATVYILVLSVFIPFASPISVQEYSGELSQLRSGRWPPRESEEAAVAEVAEGEAPAEAAPKPATVEKVDLTPDALKSLFANLVDAGSKHITKDVFSRVMRVIFKVVKETPITKELAVAGDDTVRQLKLNEALELIKGPELEETMKVKRVHAKALSDGAEGWVTLAGNQGTAFLVENHGLFKVTRESHVYAAMEVGEDAKPIEGSRRLREGEVCEVISWPAKHEESGLMRMQVKAKLDSLTGWITQASKEGVAFAELL